MPRFSIVVPLTLTLAFTTFAQKTKDNPTEWPMYTRDLAGTRYSPLKQIDTGNVGKLAQAWSYKLRTGTPAGRGGGAGRGNAGANAPANAGADPGDFAAQAANPPKGNVANAEATPIVAGGVMYLPAGGRVIALEPETGKEVWVSQLPYGTDSRGVAYWPGDKDNPPRVIVTAGTHMLGINANSGKLDPGFGKEGVVDITIPWRGVPAIYKNVIMLGATVGEIPIGPPGDTRAYDARTGAKLWEFHTVPQPGDKGFGSWEKESWKGFSGVNVWGWYLTADEERGILYMPLGSPAGNYYGGDRPGSNLFGNSIVAVDANTGKYLWHYQTVHHDIWDADLPPAPSLVDITVNGKKVPALAAIGKTGWMFILDRVTGKPVFRVEEKPVPKGNVPGEWYSPTQPFPTKPAALARTSFKMSDLVTAEDTTPEHVAACKAFIEKSGGFYNEGPFTPFLFHEADAPPKSTIIFPGNGGANWGGTAADPTTGYVYVQTHDSALVGWMEKKVPGGNYGSGNGSPQLYDRGSVDGPGPYHGFSAQAKDASGKVLGNLPCQRPPWGRLFAVNANTGDIAWQVPLGITESLPEGKQNTGNSGSAGPIVTAGGLVFIGATNDSRFRAFNSKTGEELWVTKLNRNANANPITYQGKDGKQYVAVIATDGVEVFALP
jgi:quinoprotein glucose dehydrogenase